MNRRELLKNLALGAGAVVALPSWANAWTPSKIMVSGVFSSKELGLLSSIASTFIPEGKSEPGALGLEVDKFLDRLFADCYSKADQEKIKQGMVLLNTTAKKSYQSAFSDCTQLQRESMLIGFSEPSTTEKEWFYDTLRKETIRGYTTSEYVMVNHYNYVMAPGHYDGCVDVVES
ncbi:gluconate 2-dehydrogenase subunit 3 family protein [uncultured Arcticibacterium sp.]|uniref:gluconate 2-dehydrogenase subunit 3 family protein n=1 Tax=uncultured Arcticibacterium sp. TaxID=2173042 RepID=UPI0030FCB048